MSLRLTAAVFVVAFAVHGMDHLRRGLADESTAILVIGTVQALLLALAASLMAMRSRWAPVVAVVVGSLNASAFVLQHVLPDWFGPLSDSFVNAPERSRVTGFSWLAAIFDILAAIAFATAGAWILRTREPLLKTGRSHER